MNSRRRVITPKESIQGSDFHLRKLLHFVVFWTLTPCSLVGGYQSLKGIYCFRLLLWRRCVPLELCHLHVRLCDTIPVNYSTSSLHVSFLWSYSSSAVQPAFYGTQRFIPVFTGACYMPLSWGRGSQFHPISVSVILIISFHLCLGLPKSLFSSCLHTTTLYVFLFSSLHITCCVPIIFLDLIILIVYEEEYKSRSCSLCSFSPCSHYFLGRAVA